MISGTTKKESEAKVLLNKLKEYNSSVHCSCSYPDSYLCAEFRMAEIEKQSYLFPSPVVFAVEYVKKGSRLFFCTSYQHFPHYFMQIRSDPTFSNDITTITWDEILLTDQPVRLYLDLDMYYENGFTDIDERAQQLWNILHSHLKEWPNSNPKLAVLSASTEKKFSQHWFIHGVPSFNDSVSVGRSLKNFFKSRADELEKIGAKSFVDTSIYSAGQNFRIIGSPKFGRTNYLLPSSLSTYNEELHLPTNQHPLFQQNCGKCKDALLSHIATVPVSQDFVQLNKDNSEQITDSIQEKGEFYLETLHEYLDCLVQLLDQPNQDLKEKERGNGLKGSKSVQQLASEYSLVCLWASENSSGDFWQDGIEELNTLCQKFINESSKSSVAEQQFFLGQINLKLSLLSEGGKRIEEKNRKKAKVIATEDSEVEKASVRKTKARIARALEVYLESPNEEMLKKYNALRLKLAYDVRQPFPKTFNSVDEAGELFKRLKIDSEKLSEQRKEKAKDSIALHTQLLIRCLCFEIDMHKNSSNSRVKNHALRFIHSSSERLENITSRGQHFQLISTSIIAEKNEIANWMNSLKYLVEIMDKSESHFQASFIKVLFEFVSNLECLE